jgi:hypothetical protein
MFVQFIYALLSLLLPVCPTEDSTNCYWDAQVHGNGMGNSAAIVALSPSRNMWFIVRADGTTDIDVKEN